MVVSGDESGLLLPERLLVTVGAVIGEAHFNTLLPSRSDRCERSSDHLFHFILLFADELLQEQRADMDQFLSSISETQPDVTVSSSEESVEVPLSEGRPYRPVQVTSLGSRSEPEGEQHRGPRACV